MGAPYGGSCEAVNDSFAPEDPRPRRRVILGPLLSTSTVRHSEERQRVEGVLIRAADAECARLIL
jgi:hypothetical protein